MILIGWRGHTSDSLLLAESLRDALIAVHGSEKAGAYAVGITPQQLSRQLAGIDPFNAWRAADRTLVRAWMRIHLQKLGDSVITEQERAFILGFVGLGKRKMARFLHAEERTERSA